MLCPMTQMSEITKVYLDNNATTKPDAGLVEQIPMALASWGNPSSIHWAGRGAKLLIREARQKLAKALNIHPLEIIFTSGGSESNNTVIKSCWSLFRNTRPEMITTQVEHPSVLKAMKWCESQGAIVHYVPVSKHGQLDLEFYQSVLSEKTSLVSIMYANNETGTLFPISQLSLLAQARGALFHSDCVQAFGKLPLDLSQLNVDFASLSGHKFYALKGSGILYSKKNSKLESLIQGGGQERHRRGGTENVLGIFAMGYMAEKMSQVSEHQQKMTGLRDAMEQRLLNEIPNIHITCAPAPRLPNTSSLVIDGVDGETLLMSLDIKGFAVSTGAACSSGNPEPSPVLLAIGLSRDQAQNSLRISLSWENTPEQVDAFVETLKSVVGRLRALSPSQEIIHV